PNGGAARAACGTARRASGQRTAKPPRYYCESVSEGASITKAIHGPICAQGTRNATGTPPRRHQDATSAASDAEVFKEGPPKPLGRSTGRAAQCDRAAGSRL